MLRRQINLEGGPLETKESLWMLVLLLKDSMFHSNKTIKTKRHVKVSKHVSHPLLRNHSSHTFLCRYILRDIVQISLKRGRQQITNSSFSSPYIS